MTQKRRSEKKLDSVLPESEYPQHPWNDPDNDGHNCVDCYPESIWKCDRYAHPGKSILPPLTEIPGLKFNSINDLLTDEDKKQIRDYGEACRIARAHAEGTLP